MTKQFWNNEDRADDEEAKAIRRDNWMMVIKVGAVLVGVGALLCSLIAILH